MVITKPTLLIVDDDASIRNTLTLIFIELGYFVRSASDGFEALTLIHESKPDILLSDLNMPGMSGFELLSVVRRLHPAIHVIATSGAFHGGVVPDGISADAFYEMASSLAYLLDLVGSNAQSNWPLRRSLNKIDPIWIIPTGRLPSTKVYVLMGCPRCLRAFLKVVGRTGCLHCHNTITFAIVPPNEPVPVASHLGRALIAKVCAIECSAVASEPNLIGQQFSF